MFATETVTTPTFVSHMTIEEAKNLRVNDCIDHRDNVGRYLYATIIEKVGSRLKIHYEEWSDTWNCYSDYSQEIDRFAKSGSISRRPPHRLMNLKQGDFVDVNPKLKHPGWVASQIRRKDRYSGQIQVIYEHDSRLYLTWVHLDDTDSVAEFKSKSQIIPAFATHSSQIYTIDITQDERSAHDEPKNSEERKEEKPKEEKSNEKKSNSDKFIELRNGLKSIGLFDNCMSIFVKHQIDDSILPLLDEQHLKELTELSLGNKIKFTKWLKEYQLSLQQRRENDNDNDISGTTITDQQQTLCVCCYENPTDMVFIPCGHIAVCQPCARQANFNTCVICGKEGTAFKTFQSI
ncbi:hypothetical protein RFI_28625 [Reticulomyxa filosa]|uniref:RING-type domain-containing protein n=1 Tax=Reticulomyxa filosa TaxID=46433 RepID=X6M5L5_RETFI|nr:hypothetical protein RFI_28625 [Reticulomyxa filosa]|eukprot:ETO08762.1 hypothetical protein RFI_28625 [Reticulomyxa filosa]